MEVVEAAPQDALAELVNLLRPMIISFDDQEEEQKEQ